MEDDNEWVWCLKGEINDVNNIVIINSSTFSVYVSCLKELLIIMIC